MGEPDVELFIKKVGERIRELREERSMTQLDLAIKSNLDESQVQRLETSRSAPTLRTLYKVVIGLDVEFEMFFQFK